MEEYCVLVPQKTVATTIRRHTHATLVNTRSCPNTAVPAIYATSSTKVHTSRRVLVTSGPVATDGDACPRVVPFCVGQCSALTFRRHTAF